MTDDHEVIHHTFTIERIYKAAPERVFAAHADPAAKRRWLAEGPGFEVTRYDLDFRVGGLETSRFTAGGTVDLTYDAVYQDIVPDRRIVFAYAMSMAGNPLSVSLATTQLFPEGGGTRLVFTEQGAYFGSPDDVAGREEGSRGILERLAEEVGG